MGEMIITRKVWLNLGIAIFIVAASSAVRAAFFGELGRGIPYLTYYPAVMIAAIIGGLPAGHLRDLERAQEVMSNDQGTREKGTERQADWTG
jgi:hypothetical protein